MARQNINAGTGNLRGDGETLHTAFKKINENFQDLYQTSGPSYYVSENGVDSTDRSGQSQNDSWASIGFALSQITGPATVHVMAGDYTEKLPLSVPENVSVVGESQRTVTVLPADNSTGQMWQLRDGTLLAHMTFKGMTGFTFGADPTDIDNFTFNGVFVGLDPSSPIINKSPYVFDCSSISTGGIGALIDGSVHSSGNRSLLIHAYTCINQDGLGYCAINNGKAEIVSGFTYYCHIGYAAGSGGILRSLNGNATYGTYGAVSQGFDATETPLTGSLYGDQIEFVNLVGTFSEGDTITGQTSLAEATVTDFQANAEKLYVKVTSGTFQEGEIVANGSGAEAEIASGGLGGQNGFILVANGFERRPVAGRSVQLAGDASSYVVRLISGSYVDSSSVLKLVLSDEKATKSADGTGLELRDKFSQVRLTGHDFLNIGTGNKTETNYPGDPVQAPSQANEIVENRPGRVYFVSTDQDGNFRVGDFFRVEQSTGIATLNANAFDLSGLSSLRLGAVGAQVGELINEFSSDGELSANSNSKVPTEAAIRTYFENVKSHIIPEENEVYDLGSPNKKWRDLYLSGNTINLGDSQIQSDNSTVVLPAGSKIGTETASTFSGSFTDLTNIPTTVAGYGITDAVKPGDDISTLTNNSGFVTQTELESGNLSINIGSLEGDLIGSVFADDSTILVDGVNGSIPYSVLSDVEVTEQDLQVDFAAIVGTQIQTNGLPLDTTAVGDLTVDGSLKTNNVTAESGNLILNADNYVYIDSINNGQIEIGRNSGIGEVIIGNTANDTDVIIEGNTIFDSGTAVDFTGTTILGTNFLTSETNDLSSSVVWANVPDANITQTSVTQHESALTITESQISDLQNYLTDETVTSLNDNGNNTITFTDENGDNTTIDLSLYLDDTNLARLTSGTLDGVTGIATFIRDDATTFTVDFSPLFDDTNLARITSASFNTADGVLTLTRNDASDVTVDLDGRYLTSVNGTVTDSLVPDTDVAYDLGSSSNRFRDLYLSGSTIDLAGTQISTDAAGDVEIKDSLNNRKKIIASEVEIGTGTERVKLARDEVTGRIKFDRFDVTTGQVVGATSADISENTTDDLPQGSTNKYFADSLARNAVSVSGDLSYNSATGVISFTERTDSEVRGLFSATGDLSYNSTTGVFSVAVPAGYDSTDFDTDFSSKDTDNLTEGIINKYYSNTLARAAFSAAGDLSYNQSTGEFSVSVPTNTSDLTNDSGYLSSVTISDIDNCIEQFQSLAIGQGALQNQTDFQSNRNTAIGYISQQSSISGSNNTSIGYSSLVLNQTGLENTGLGVSAGLAVLGSLNTAVGANALRGTESGATGDGNTAVGARSGGSVRSSGDNNTSIGLDAGKNIQTGSNNIFIGYNAQPTSSSANNEIIVGNSNNDRLRIPGIDLDTNDAADGEVLQWNVTNGGFVWTGLPTNTSDLTNDSGFIDSSGGTIIGNLRLSHDSPADAELEFENADIDGFRIKAESGNMLIRFYSESDTAEDQIIIRAQDGVDKFNFDIGSGDFSAEGGITSKGVLSIEQGTQESFSTITNATGTVTHDCSNGYIFRHTTPSADWTANFTNLSLTTQHATALTIVITQGATAYVPTAVQIEGASQTILWQGGSAPSGTANGTDVVSFSVLNDNGSFVVLGQLASFGG